MIGNNHKQATVAYPSALSNRPPGSDATDDESSSDGDDEAPIPLVPATLPIRPGPKSDRQQPMLGTQLPYNPPPATPHAGHHSAHRSQYPASNQQRGNYDVASVATPVFVDQAAEMKLSPARQQPSEQAYKPAATAPPVSSPNTGASQDLASTIATSGSQPSKPNQSSFNLVINHGAPAQVNTAKSLQPAYPATSANSNAAKANRKWSVSGQQAPAGVGSSTTVSPSKAPTRQAPTPPSPTPAKLRQQSGLPSASKAIQVDSARSQSPIGKQDYQRKPVEVVGARPGLVDLTSGKQQGSVGSDALNDGLLLIVRHGGNAGAFSPIEKSKVDDSKAYAVDPFIVRPNSPIDAQLFPNVQGVLASVNPAPAGSQSAQTVQHVQHVSAEPAPQQQLSPQKQRQQVSPPLMRMEPPKPSLDRASDTNHNADHEQLAKSGQHQQPKYTSLSGQQTPSKSRAKKAKKLKAVQSPSAKPIFQSTSPSPVSIEGVTRQELARTGRQISLTSVNQADQPVNIVEDRHRSARLNIS